ncbi:MAG: DEAD/DEAH box helicase [Lachnospiraceae bacterium]|jgi:ATP-dependent Lhr-like helicase|nr:DEAD/DEAH box helicase [Lachnospiraceae bacterium]MCH4031003.1 DEAD/DEAH box helicase [Lachnospiraceae bacterium]MCH4108427.1 DEAD/DEAH box helicase [Lachnospiraceae bacterium]MCI1302558.1 DEAD/DEAH box helicase [Lachnospiraceae bacterium]MCI1331731.1 DEAD/DEAH box helicase [Lachnospiraceae bacterium]
MNAFERYAPFIQDYIYRSGWRSLRAVQAAAADAIFDTDDNVLLLASTASGKTEAAFFPILTQLYENPPSSVGVIYIGPLKALINDQFSRLSDLCADAGVPVWHWHGDVSASHKAKLLKNPSGILQITPESLEALLLHKHGYIPKLFGDLRFIVIDEVHSLLRGARGEQCLCLMERLSRMAGVNPRRIGLSATVGNPEMAGEFLSAGTGRDCVIPKISAKGQTMRLSVDQFWIPDPLREEKKDKDGKQKNETAEDAEVISGISLDKNTAAPSSAASVKTDRAPAAADAGLAYIFEHTRGKKSLIFCNSREEAEGVTTTLRQYCEARHEPDRFLIHHGNLSASYRQSAEEIMRDESANFATVTTSTLELGIDIGQLEQVFQINAPFTVSSFLQRMGRSGRRGEPPQMRIVIREQMQQERDMAPACVPWSLVQACALIQLYLEERWVEPPRLNPLPYSLLYHQTMAILASEGEMSPGQLAGKVLSLAPFAGVSMDDYRVLLKSLIQNDHIEQTESGGLIVGLEGEKITNSFKFYAVFQENEEFTVRSESQELGTIVAPPPAGEKIAIAGHVWVVDEVDVKRHVVYCTQTKGNIPAYFGLCPGDINTRILERMKQVLAEDRMYPYLQNNARLRLQEARKLAAEAGFLACPLIRLGGSMWALFPWLGTYAFLALERLIKIKCAPLLGLKGFEVSRPYYMQFTMSATPEEFFRTLIKAAETDFPDMDLVYKKEVPVFEKYDVFVPAELVRKSFAKGVLDIAGMRRRVLLWKKFAHEGITGERRAGIEEK